MCTKYDEHTYTMHSFLESCVSGVWCTWCHPPPWGPVSAALWFHGEVAAAETGSKHTGWLNTAPWKPLIPIRQPKTMSMPTSPPSFYFPHTIATINDSSTFISSLKVKWARHVVKVWLKSLSRIDVLLPGHLDLRYQPMGHTPCWDKIWEL